MIEPNTSFRRGVVNPVECYRQGWALIKEEYWLFLGIAFVAVLIASFGPFGILMGPCMCGLYLCYFSRMNGKKPQFDLLFKGFDHFVQSLIATLIMMVPMIVVMIPAGIAFFIAVLASLPEPKPGAKPDPDDLIQIFVAYAGFGVVTVLISFAFQVFFLFTYPLIVDRGLTGPQAVMTSFRAASGNLGGVIGLVVLQFLASMVGMCACYVGAVFVIPISFAATAVAYRNVFPTGSFPVPEANIGDEDA